MVLVELVGTGKIKILRFAPTTLQSSEMAQGAVSAWSSEHVEVRAEQENRWLVHLRLEGRGSASSQDFLTSATFARRSKKRDFSHNMNQFRFFFI